MNADTSSLRANANNVFATMKQEQSNYPKVVNEEAVNVAKRALNQPPICGSEALKKDIVINSAAPLSMGLVPTAQLITVQLNNVASKPLEKLSAGPIFNSRGHNIPIPILAKPVSPNVPRRRLCNSTQETTAFPCQNYNRFRHKSSQTEVSALQSDAFVDTVKKIAVTLDEMKVKLTSVQSKITSLEARFTAVYGDDTLLSAAEPPKAGSGEKSYFPSRRKHSFALNSSRFWASRRLACRLAAEKLQQDEGKTNCTLTLPAPPPPPLASTPGAVPARRSRRFVANGGFGGEQTAPVTKAKIAKLLMNARLEMAAEEKERLEVQASGSASSSEDAKSIQSIDQQPNLSSCLLGVRDEAAALPPILPLLSATNGGGGGGREVGKLPMASGADVDEGMVVSTLGNRESPRKSAVTGERTPSVSSASPSTLPQLPPIPAKYRRPMLLDTSEIARQTKDMLLKCAISQRSFGQNVLGLSQGSVSDLLTRPKPWSMLTNKGREPFIRMKLFLENPRSLNGFEYNISAGKEGALAVKHEKSEDVSAKSQQDSLPGDTADSFKSTSVMDSVSTPPRVNITATPMAAASLSCKPDNCSRSSISIRSSEAQRLLKEGFDVMKTVADAKLLLNTTSMTQRALGNTILGLSQASVSDLLCKCRPWDQISGNKPRESYVRLKLWVDSVRLASGLNDDASENVAERKSKRQRTESGSSAVVDTESKQLTDQQLDVLVNFFDQCPQPDPNDISELAKQICCSLEDVNGWFETRRLGGKISTSSSIMKEDHPQNTIGKDSSPTPQNNQSPISTASLNRRKKTVPTRILPSSIESPSESAVSPPSTP
ncbi:homeobox protein cut 1 [Echinococcus multilocularis]|uniref:DNA-binding protein SATB n=1 Tax=Echinococcus multilocularis TaxID=6211 RepID=A0A068Y7P7_ECHMU|nr:homeobox protein cut 1 [Echinococcus multilocularis]